MNEKVKLALESILQRFESGDIPEAIAYSTFPVYDIPSARWSLLNRLLMFIAGTRDARGIKQWNQAGRHVKKGAKAFTILAPRIIKKVVGDNGNGEDKELEEGDQGETIKVLAGFLGIPVFRVEDTEGEPLVYETIKLPELPLMEVAQSWGVSVKGIPWDRLYYGFFRHDRNEIALATEEETVFFHELSHVAHQKVLDEKLRNGQDWKQEIVAELSAVVLCHLFGKTPSRHLGNSYRYISRYAGETGLTPVQGCYQVMKDVEAVLNLIFNHVGLEKGSLETAAKVG
jgi:hypothetical protein